VNQEANIVPLVKGEAEEDLGKRGGVFIPLTEILRFAQNDNTIIPLTLILSPGGERKFKKGAGYCKLITVNCELHEQTPSHRRP